MLDANKMTPEGLRELARKKEQENRYKQVKQGFLKNDLYSFGYEPGYSYFRFEEMRSDILTLQGKRQIEKMFKSCFFLIAPKGTKFVCFKDMKSGLTMRRLG
jgi:hypothetical protein